MESWQLRMPVAVHVARDGISTCASHRGPSSGIQVLLAHACHHIHICQTVRRTSTVVGGYACYDHSAVVVAVGRAGESVAVVAPCSIRWQAGAVDENECKEDVHTRDYACKAVDPCVVVCTMDLVLQCTVIAQAAQHVWAECT
jgi:hypothetical protein